MGVAASRQEAFWEACGFGHTERVKKFIEGGDIDVNWVSYTHDCCPIHVASQGKLEIVKILLEAKCNVNVTDVRGNLPLHHAAMKGHDEIIQVLLDAGSDINTQDKNGWTPLHCAAYWNHPSAVKVLLKNKADATIQNKDERTALHETARSQERDDPKLGEIAQCLIAAGADVNAKSSDLGEADFTGLMFAAYHNHPEVASAFIDAGCDINAYGTNRWTALHWAADRGNDELVFLLLEAGADPTIKGWRNERAADRAQSSEIKDILKNAMNMLEELSLLESASISSKSAGSTPLMMSPSDSVRFTADSDLTNSTTNKTNDDQNTIILNKHLYTEQKSDKSPPDSSSEEYLTEPSSENTKSDSVEHEDTELGITVQSKIDIEKDSTFSHISVPESPSKTGVNDIKISDSTKKIANEGSRCEGTSKENLKSSECGGEEDSHHMTESNQSDLTLKECVNNKSVSGNTGIDAI